MTDNLKIFRDEFLNANTWAQRKDGIPLDLLDNLSEEELKKAEKELINILSTNDEIGRIKALKKENEQLRKLLVKKDIDKLVVDSYLEVASENLGYKNVDELKKNLNTKP